jgi:hypothetical protein
MWVEIEQGKCAHKNCGFKSDEGVALLQTD